MQARYVTDKDACAHVLDAVLRSRFTLAPAGNVP